MPDEMIYKLIEEMSFENDGNIIADEVKTIKISLKEDLVGRQFVFMSKNDGEEKIMYNDGLIDKKKPAQAYTEITERLSKWKFKQRKDEE